MKTKLPVVVLVFSMLAPGAAFAAGDEAAGKTKSAVCAACHGVDGNSPNPEWPSLAGQSVNYLSKQLQDFKAKRRENALMSGQAVALSEQDIADLAAFFAAQAPKLGRAQEENLALGEAIYRGGIRDANVPACMGCHAPNGAGNPAASFPRLAGQHAKYTVLQLRAFSAAQRSNDQNEMMRNIASRLSSADMSAVAQYIAGLH
ncbi:MAG: c-type cytochrome [Gammaproteobacteria bacterium]